MQQGISPNSTLKKTRKVYTLRKTINLKGNNQQSVDNKTQINEKQILQQQKMQMSVQSVNNNASNINNNNMVQSLNRGQQSRISAGGNTNIQQSYVSQNKNQIFIPQYKPLVQGSQLFIDKLSLQFNTQLNNMQVKELKVRNIGESAIYFQWICKNISKINSSAVKDPKSRFYCHYQNNVIKPGQEITFAFSFLSDVPGIYIQEYNFICRPPLKTQIPCIKLQGKAFIDDQHATQRQRILQQLKQNTLSTDVHEILQDILNQVKPPKPPLPDVTKPQIAERQFESKNLSLGLFYNPIVHGWFRQLFKEVWVKINGQIQKQQELMKQKQDQLQQGNEQNKQDHIQQKNKKKPFEPFWDQSVETLKQMITSSQQSQINQVQKICFLERLNHYYHLSTFAPSNKSQLFQTVKKYLFESAFKLGGDFNDQTRKQLEMWETAFREPLEDDTQQNLKVYKEEISKIKAQWLKKAKKKKWTEDDEKALVEDYRKKLGDRVFQDILKKFQGFQEKAEFIKVESLLNKTSINIQKYSDFLQRIKTVKQTPIQGKKVLLKFNLKLQPNSQQKLQQLKQYIQLKKQQQKRLQQQKKNQQQNAKKKKAPPKKKKGGKEQQQSVIKPLVFDFMSLLDEENWNGFVQTYKLIQEKSPMLTLIGCSFGKRLGRYIQEYSIKFLMEYLRNTVDPAIQFLEHENLPQIYNKIVEQTLNEGSIYLMENLNFLPYEVMQKQDQVANEQQKAQEGQEKIAVKYQLRKLLYPEISNAMRDQLKGIVDIVVSEDRFAQNSGIMSYLFKKNILGALWWKYLSFVLRLYKNWKSKGNNFAVFGGTFDAEKLMIIGRLLLNKKNQNNLKQQEKQRSLAESIHLFGQIGVKFALVQHWNQQNIQIPPQGKNWFGFNVSKNQSKVITRFLTQLKQNNLSKSLILPTDVIVRLKQQSSQQQKQGQQKLQIKNLKTHCIKINQVEDLPQEQKFSISDIGKNSLEQFSFNVLRNPGHCFIFGNPTLFNSSFYTKQTELSSLVTLIRMIYKTQQQKKNRHQLQQMTPSGINYQKDLVILLCGINQNQIQKMSLKQKKRKQKKINQDGQQQQQQAQQQEQQNNDEQGRKKIDLVGNFRVCSQKCIFRLLNGKFNVGIRDIQRYPKSDD